MDTDRKKQRRSFADVIGRVIAEVPRDEFVMRSRLDKLRTDAWFQPPESSQPWHQLRIIFEDRFPGGKVGAPAWASVCSSIIVGGLAKK